MSREYRFVISNLREQTSANQRTHTAFTHLDIEFVPRTHFLGCIPTGSQIATGQPLIPLTITDSVDQTQVMDTELFRPRTNAVIWSIRLHDSMRSRDATG